MAQDKNNPFTDLPEDQIYSELDIDTLEAIYQRLQNWADQKEDTLVIIDDFASSLKDKQLLKLFNSIINNRRHLYTSVWMSVQTYRSILLSNRRTINYLVMFKPANKKEIDAVWEEMSMLSKDDFVNVIKYVFDRPHEFLVLDRDNDTMYKGFNQIKISDALGIEHDKTQEEQDKSQK
jgi:hypothetical protein